jgi:uncharacterized membrane protein
MSDSTTALIELVARAVELVGIAVMVLGAAWASAVAARRALGRAGGAYHEYRANLGRAILLGLEFLVFADIIGTVAIEPTFENLGVLALIVLVRTFLSFTLELEVTGRWPWDSARGDRDGGGDEHGMHGSSRGDAPERARRGGPP